jgi:hypothetical protein
MEEFRKTMLTGKHISHLVDYTKMSTAFPGVDFEGGVGLVAEWRGASPMSALSDCCATGANLRYCKYSNILLCPRAPGVCARLRGDMGSHYSTRDFFRQMPNRLLARRFEGRAGIEFEPRTADS